MNPTPTERTAPGNPVSLAFERLENTGNQPSLWRLDQINVRVAGHETPIGHLRISYVPGHRVEAWTDIYRFLADRGGSFGMFGIKDPHGASHEDWATLAFRVQEKLQGWNAANASCWQQCPLGDIQAALESYRPRLETLLATRKAEFIDFHVDKPMVDHIEVEAEWRGRGVGQALYEQGAQWMAERHLVLHASGIQTPLAQKAWERLEKQARVNVEESCYHPPRRFLRR